MAKVVPCQTCHGRGEIYKEVKPGKWEWVKCPAGCNNGKITIPTI
jgi:DnaJ-class molecular chaperone